MQGLVIMTLIDGKASPNETAHVEQFAQALGVDSPEVKNVRHVLKGEILQLRLDLVRRFWLRQKVTEVWNKEGIRGLSKFVRGMMGRYENRGWQLATRSWNIVRQALWAVPFGNIGMRTGSRFLDKRAGRPSKSCSMIVPTFCRAMERLRKKKSRSPASAPVSSVASRGCSCFFVLLQFHVGIRMTPITEARTGMFDPLKAMIAIRRGAAMNVDLNDGWDYWSVMDEQVEELRRRYNILPAEAFLSASRRRCGRGLSDTVCAEGSSVAGLGNIQEGDGDDISQSLRNIVGEFLGFYDRNSR